MSTYRRLLGFLRPHAGRFAGNIAANVVGAALDGIAFLLLIPFLNTLFNQPQAIPTGRGWLTQCRRFRARDLPKNQFIR